MKAEEHFGHYLVGKPFRIKTDHKALEALQTSRKLTGCLARWALSLQQYHFVVQYKPGKMNQDADSLSRQAWDGAGEECLDEDIELEVGKDVEGQPPRCGGTASTTEQ